MSYTTVTTITIGSRVFKTRKGAQNEVDRSLEWAAGGGSSLDVIEHEGGYVVVHVSDIYTVEQAQRWLATGQILDAVFA